jgi:ribosome-binding protein aMBF1 (putative translation factor)
MLGHTRKHRISSSDIRPNLNEVKKEDFIPWRETSKERIEKYTEPGIMIRGSRYKADLTQKQLAELLNIHQHHISEMETGKRSIGKEMAKRLAALFKTDYRLFL